MRVTRRFIPMTWIVGCLVWGVASVGGARTIDDPDLPDQAQRFEQRAQPYEDALGATDGGSAAARAGQRYAKFLDAELDKALRFLRGHLPPAEWAALQRSQQRWLAYRESEQRFIEQRWTQDRFGTSASLSASGHRTALTKARVIALWRYAADAS